MDETKPPIRVGATGPRPGEEAPSEGGLRPPPGYGVAGPGRAVFSVSSFMDTLQPEAVPVEEAVPAGD